MQITCMTRFYQTLSCKKLPNVSVSYSQNELLRISNITGLERLTELKVLNLAGNLIRKVTGVQNLGCVEELNLRWVKNLQNIVVILVQEEQNTNNRGFAVGAKPAEAVHVQQRDPGAGLPRQAGEPGPAADVADGGEPGVEQPGLQLPPRLLPPLPINSRPAGCHPRDERQCQKVTFLLQSCQLWQSWQC